jgi:hypothetical protein
LLLLASIALGFPAEHEKMRETRTPYSKSKLKQKERRKNENKKQINPHSSD